MRSYIKVLRKKTDDVEEEYGESTHPSKGQPFDVVRQALSAVEAGRDEVLLVDVTRQVKAGLSDREGIYLTFDPEHAVHAAK